MTRRRLRYPDFVEEIDIDALEDEMGIEVLNTRGEEDIAKCPDFWGLHKHGDTTGKFAINRESRVWNCFVCEGGNLLSLAMAYLDTDEEEATAWLYQFATGDVRTDSEFVVEFKKLLDRSSDKLSTEMPYFNKHVLHQFNGDEPTLMSWCHGRAISTLVMQEYELAWSELYKRPAPYKGGEKIADDYYGPCVVFPHYWQGRLVGWQSRWLEYPDTPKWLAKYTNTTDFPAHETVYGYEKALKRSGSVWVVESVPTALVLLSYHFNAVATFGAGVKDKQLKLLRHFDHVIVAPDNDKPGRGLVNKCVKYLSDYCDLEILKPVGELDSGNDIGDLDLLGPRRYPKNIIGEYYHDNRYKPGIYGDLIDE